jgi:hypothetical protein
MKPTRRTRLRGAALLALTAVLPSAPVAWALGELSQKPGTAGCVSDLSSRSSSRSALVSPSSRSPRSRPPCRRQLRNVCGDTPKLSATSGIERP